MREKKNDPFCNYFLKPCLYKASVKFEKFVHPRVISKIFFADVHRDRVINR